ncbi:MAG: transcriptional regulator [Acetobacterium sp.]|nr:transcriptional regulator [Acetobacterium sp.]
MELKDKILACMTQNGSPMTAGEVEKALKVDRKEIDQAFKLLKKEEAIVSPVRCKWEPAKK